VCTHMHSTVFDDHRPRYHTWYGLASPAQTVLIRHDTAPHPAYRSDPIARPTRGSS
jgi:hypothetical protein